MSSADQFIETGTGRKNNSRRNDFYVWSGLGDLSFESVKTLNSLTCYDQFGRDLRMVLKKLLHYYSWRKEKEGGINHYTALPEMPDIDEPSSSLDTSDEVIFVETRPSNYFADGDAPASPARSPQYGDDEMQRGPSYSMSPHYDRPLSPIDPPQRCEMETQTDENGVDENELSLDSLSIDERVASASSHAPGIDAAEKERSASLSASSTPTEKNAASEVEKSRLWEEEEAMGEQAIVEEVLHVNEKFPNLKEAMPLWKDRMHFIVGAWKHASFERQMNCNRNAKNNILKRQLGQIDAPSHARHPSSSPQPQSLDETSNVSLPPPFVIDSTFHDDQRSLMSSPASLIIDEDDGENRLWSFAISDAPDEAAAADEAHNEGSEEAQRDLTAVEDANEETDEAMVNDETEEATVEMAKNDAHEVGEDADAQHVPSNPAAPPSIAPAEAVAADETERSKEAPSDALEEHDSRIIEEANDDHPNDSAAEEVAAAPVTVGQENAAAAAASDAASVLSTPVATHDEDTDGSAVNEGEDEYDESPERNEKTDEVSAAEGVSTSGVSKETAEGSGVVTLDDVDAPQEVVDISSDSLTSEEEVTVITPPKREEGPPRKKRRVEGDHEVDSSSASAHPSSSEDSESRAMSISPSLPPPPAPPSTAEMQKQRKQTPIQQVQPVQQGQPPLPAAKQNMPQAPSFSAPPLPPHRNPTHISVPRMDGPFPPPGLGAPNFHQNGPFDTDMRQGYGQRDHLNLSRPPFENTPFPNPHPFGPPQNTGVPQQGYHVPNPRCAFCSDFHHSELCFRVDTYEKRRAYIIQNHLCHHCLGPRLPSCNAPSHIASCPICHRHNSHVAFCKMLINERRLQNW